MLIAATLSLVMAAAPPALPDLAGQTQQMRDDIETLGKSLSLHGRWKVEEYYTLTPTPPQQYIADPNRAASGTFTFDCERPRAKYSAHIEAITKSLRDKPKDELWINLDGRDIAFACDERAGVNLAKRHSKRDTQKSSRKYWYFPIFTPYPLNLREFIAYPLLPRRKGDGPTFPSFDVLEQSADRITILVPLFDTTMYIERKYTFQRYSDRWLIVREFELYDGTTTGVWGVESLYAWTAITRDGQQFYFPTYLADLYYASMPEGLTVTSYSMTQIDSTAEQIASERPTVETLDELEAQAWGTPPRTPWGRWLAGGAGAMMLTRRWRGRP